MTITCINLTKKYNQQTVPLYDKEFRHLYVLVPSESPGTNPLK